MKIKVGNRIYSGEDEPIMVVLTDKDKENIANMLPECTKYCEYDNETHTIKEIEKWMKDI